MIQNRLTNKAKRQAPTQLGRMVNQLSEVIHSGLLTREVTQATLALEGLQDQQRHQLDTAYTELTTSVESIYDQLFPNTAGKDKITVAQIEAGSIAGMLAGDFRSAMSHKVDMPVIGTENMAVVQPTGLADAMSQRAFGLEAYDERENRNATIYSIAYNVFSARQDEFGETFFPTLVITPDQVGFGVSVNLMMVYDGVERKITGSFEDFKKKNIIRAVTDPTVLRKEQTRIVPVVRAQSVDKFVDSAIIPAAPIVLEGETINTAPIAFGKKVDLLGLSQTDTLLAAGVMDQTDSIDPSVQLRDVYAKIGDDVLRFKTKELPLANFTYATQNNYRVQNLNFTTTSVLLNKDTKNLDGSALSDLAGIVTGDLIVRLELQVSGSINIETGETNLIAGRPAVYSIRNAVGDELDLTVAPAKAIVDAVAAGELIGYDLFAYRTNMNRRQRGQLIDVTKYTQLYNVPLRAPITTIHPINTDGQTDASDVQALITTTRIRTSNEAVATLLNTAEILREYVDSRDVTGVGPDVLGVGRFFVRPTFFHEALDVNASIDSIKSHERAEDIQAVLVNKIRDYAYRMYRDSEFKAAADALAGGISPTPTVIVGTDPVIARYLTVTGDLRTLGSEFDVRIVSTLDVRVKGKIFIGFGVFDDNRNVAPNPLNFGNLVWAPELVLTANISRGNTISKETVVQPRMTFVVHCPILTVIEVSNIPETLNKIALFIKEQP